MHLKFYAKEVNYSEALGGDLVQVSFQEEPDLEIDYSKKNHPLPPLMKYVLFSANYEFLPCDTTVEWSDGKDYDGLKLIEEIALTKTELNLVLEDGNRIDVNFRTDDITFYKIQRFLLNEE